MRTTPLSSSQLGKWIAQNMPDLAKELGPMTLNNARQRLNEVTGLSIKSSDSIEKSLPQYLEKLKEMQSRN